jgi:hypothetical protein
VSGVSEGRPSVGMREVRCCSTYAVAGLRFRPANGQVHLATTALTHTHPRMWLGRWRLRPTARQRTPLRPGRCLRPPRPILDLRSSILEQFPLKKIEVPPPFTSKVDLYIQSQHTKYFLL